MGGQGFLLGAATHADADGFQTVPGGQLWGARAGTPRPDRAGADGTSRAISAVTRREGSSTVPSPANRMFASTSHPVIGGSVR